MAWMMVITRRRAIGSLRRLVPSRGNLTLSSEQHGEEGSPANQPDPGSALDVKRLSEAVRCHVDQLKTMQRNVLTLAFRSDMSTSEVASCTGMPIGIVKTCVLRGLINLRAAMIVQASLVH